MPRSLIFLVIGAFLISVALSFHWQFRPRVDAGAYDAIGWNLARGLGYVEHEANALRPEKDDAIVRVGPGYEFFLAGIYKLVGHRIPVVWVVQAALHALAMILVYTIALLLFPAMDRRVGVIAAALFGFSPDLIFINSMLLTEGLFLFLLIAAVYATFYLLEHPVSRGGWVIAGILWALAILTRPVALLPFAVALGVLLWRQHRQVAVLACLPALLLVGLWSGIMSARYGTFILTTTAGGLDLWVGNNPGATGGFVKTPEIQVFRDTHHSTAVDAEGWRRYISFLVHEPAAFLELQVRKAALYFSMIRPTGLWLDLQFFPVDRLVLLGSSALWTAALFLFGAGGIVLMLTRKPWDIGIRLFAAFAFLQPLVVIPIIVETRYRYALFPFLAIGAAYLIMAWVQGISRRAFLSVLVWPAVAIVVLTFYDISRNAAEILTKVTSVFL